MQATISESRNQKLPPEKRAAAAAAAAPHRFQNIFQWARKIARRTSPWIVASDDLNAADKRIESWRDAGFTTALVLPEEAIIAGQGSLIDLNDERVSQMIVRSHAALRIGLRPETWGFPDSLMGVISYLRQVNDDTAWYDVAAPTYAAHPNGIERPNVDRTEEIMTLILHRKEPVLFPANTLVEIPRAMRLAQEWNLHAVLYGGQQSYEVADLIAAKKYQVIVNLKWPEGPKDPDPENIPSLRELRFRDRAPGSPAALAKVGVKFAFSSGGLADPKEIQKNVRKATAAGLSSDAALRAFTLDAAEILGVVGSTRQHRARKNRESRDCRWRSLRRKNESKARVRGRPPFRNSRSRNAAQTGRKTRRAAASNRTTIPRWADEPEIDRYRDRSSRHASDRRRGRRASRAPARADAKPNVTLIKNATILTITHGNIEHGSILIRDGKIAEVGADIKAPEGATVIDASGEFVLPGIIDCHSHIAVSGDVNEGSLAVTSMVNIGDVLNSEDPIDLLRSRRRRHRRECAARQRESDRRANDRDQAALGQALERVAVRRRAARN